MPFSFCSMSSIGKLLREYILLPPPKKFLLARIPFTNSEGCSSAIHKDQAPSTTLKDSAFKRSNTLNLFRPSLIPFNE